MNRTQRNAAADAKLAEVYARIPAVACKGLCHTTCGPIEMSNRERAKIRERHGIDIPEVAPNQRLANVEYLDCPALDVFKRCSVYDDRPTICRVWGSSESLPCIYGCEVDGEPLSPVETQAAALDAYNAGGWPPSTTFHRHEMYASGDELRADAAQNPGVEMEIRQRHAHGLKYDRRHAREAGYGNEVVR